MATVAEVFALALQHHQAGNLRQAEQLYHDILRADPRHADAHHLLGVLFCQAGRFEQARASIREALRLDPQAAVYHANLGVAYEALGQLDEAAASYQQALRLRPHDADSHYNLGNVWRRQEKWDEAVAQYRQALSLVPTYANAHCNLGLALAAQGKLDAAVAHYQEALRLDPNAAEVHNNLGVARVEQGRLDEAVAGHREALRINPNFAQAHHSLGCALQRQNKLEEALQCYHQALSLDPQYAEAHWNRSLLRLLAGDFERGWPEYEWRWTQPGFTRRHLSHPLWDGADLAGRTILLHAEQGLGDTLHMIRYVRLVKQRGGNVIVECQPPLVRLLTGVPQIDHLAAQGSPLPPFDVQAPLLSLPGIFHTSLANVSASVPYLQADPVLVEHWKSPKSEVRSPKSEELHLTSDIGHRTSDFLVGIAWQGNPAFRGDRQRSIPLGHLAPLAQVEGVQLISLQKGAGTDGLKQLRIADCGLRIERQETKPLLESAIRNPQSAILDLGSRLDEASGAFMDTAAVMMNIDLVISADTAVAHLAGALGIPVWVALPLVPDWRWLLERDDSPWYPTMRLFRQTRNGHWEDVFERIAEELKAVVSCQKINYWHLTTNN